jgi:hypothetical protein
VNIDWLTVRLFCILSLTANMFGVGSIWITIFLHGLGLNVRQAAWLKCTYCGWKFCLDDSLFCFIKVWMFSPLSAKSIVLVSLHGLSMLRRIEHGWLVAPFTLPVFYSVSNTRRILIFFSFGELLHSNTVEVTVILQHRLEESRRVICPYITRTSVGDSPTFKYCWSYSHLATSARGK